MTTPDRCPVCGTAELADIAWDHDPDLRVPTQTAESREVVSFTCGHDVIGPSLATADADRLDVERRRSPETAEPRPPTEGTDAAEA
jgi:hypothetical protein